MGSPSAPYLLSASHRGIRPGGGIGRQVQITLTIPGPIHRHDRRGHRSGVAGGPRIAIRRIRSIEEDVRPGFRPARGSGLQGGPADAACLHRPSRAAADGASRCARGRGARCVRSREGGDARLPARISARALAPPSVKEDRDLRLGPGKTPHICRRPTGGCHTITTLGVLTNPQPRRRMRHLGVETGAIAIQANARLYALLIIS